MDREMHVNVTPKVSNGIIIAMHFKDNNDCYSIEPDVRIITSKNVHQLSVTIKPLSTERTLYDRQSCVINVLGGDNDSRSDQQNQAAPYLSTTSRSTSSDEEENIQQNIHTDTTVHVQTPINDSVNYTSLGVPTPPISSDNDTNIDVHPTTPKIVQYAQQRRPFTTNNNSQNVKTTHISQRYHQLDQDDTTKPQEVSNSSSSTPSKDYSPDPSTDHFQCNNSPLPKYD